MATGIFLTFVLGPVIGFATGALLINAGLFVPLAVLLGMFGLFGGMFGGGLLVRRYVRPLSKPKNRDEEIIVQAIQKTDSLNKLITENKLVRWLDPVAGQLLEAGAFHYARIHSCLDAPMWRSGDLPDHWRNLRSRAKEASERAMSELVILLGGCTGEPSRSKEDDIKDMFSSLAGLNIVDALQGLGQVISTNSDDYVFQSAEAQIAFEPGRQIAERLKTLADEVEEASRQAHADTIEIPDIGTSLDSIDQLLGDFRAVRQAENELDESQRIQY